MPSLLGGLDILWLVGLGIFLRRLAVFCFYAAIQKGGVFVRSYSFVADYASLPRSPPPPNTPNRTPFSGALLGSGPAAGRNYVPIPLRTPAPFSRPDIR